mmetsp:Transcript_8410/g.18341  ORF Transcript_8410/g.18341 Transcript_8410/m.18341 type:complete len:218 (+) Transcript_8410:537-1190(+)
MRAVHRASRGESMRRAPATLAWGASHRTPPSLRRTYPPIPSYVRRPSSRSPRHRRRAPQTASRTRRRRRGQTCRLASCKGRQACSKQGCSKLRCSKQPCSKRRCSKQRCIKQHCNRRAGARRSLRARFNRAAAGLPLRRRRTSARRLPRTTRLRRCWRRRCRACCNRECASNRRGPSSLRCQTDSIATQATHRSRATRARAPDQTSSRRRADASAQH